MTNPDQSACASSIRATTLIAAVRALVPVMQDRAPVLDAEAMFPASDVADLAAVGLLAAPVPESLGGLGAGTEPSGGRIALEVLRLCGQGNPSVARLVEAHMNALRLIVRYGTPMQVREAVADALAGHLFGLWVTDARADSVRVVAGRLCGRKEPCSGAGHCTRAVITAEHNGETRLVFVRLSGREPVAPLRGMQGMRAAANGAVSVDGVLAPNGFIIGRPGDYLREPDFSCGAWRTSAATLGVLDALVQATGLHLVGRNQADAPMQQARFGQILIAQETARLWVGRAADIAEAQGESDAAAMVAYVNLARLAVEAACLDALRHIQASLGLTAFLAPHPVERLARDLGTYLRQPARDAVLLETAAWTLKGLS